MTRIITVVVRIISTHPHKNAEIVTPLARLVAVLFLVIVIHASPTVPITPVPNLANVNKKHLIIFIHKF
jgi:hypothetical protein